MADGVQDSGGGGADGGDGRHWLAGEKSDFGPNIVTQLAKRLAKFHQGDFQELHGFAAKVEEDAFSGANSTGDYMKNVPVKIFSLEKEHLLTQMRQQTGPANEVQAGNSFVAAMPQAAKVSSPEDPKEEIFQQIKQWKDKYLLELIEFDRDLVAPILTEGHVWSLFREDLNKSNKRAVTKRRLTYMLEFLQLQKSDVFEGLKEMLPIYEAAIDDLLCATRKAKAQNRKTNCPEQPQTVNLTGAAAPFPVGKSRQQQQQDQCADVSPSFPINSPEDQVPCEGPETPVAKKSLDHLADAMRASSPEALRRSFHSIWSVITKNDSVPLGEIGAFPGWIQQQGGSRVLNKMKRVFEHTASPPGSPAFGSMDGRFMASECGALDSESSREHGVKRQKIQNAKHDLLEEIKAINWTLMDTVISITGDDDGITPCDVGTRINLSYSAVSLSPDLKSLFAESGMPIVMPVELFVPADYPRSSPVLIDDKGDDQLRKKLSVILDSVDPAFRLAVSKLPEPRSTEKIVRAWDTCVREAVIEFARQRGGGTLSSTYGRWEWYCVDP